MNSFSTHAIMLRRIDYGDYDLIITFFTPDSGKVSVIAKSAKRSKKRFAGILELFSVLQVVFSRGRGLPVLQEATLNQPFIKIRTDIKKTAYASYWAELINEWIEEGEAQVRLYELFLYVLGELDIGNIPEPVLSILFQMKFMSISGFYPNLTHCNLCGIEMENMKKNRIMFDLEGGGIVCEKCVSPLLSTHDPGRRGPVRRIYISKGTIKQLLWFENGNLEKSGRVRFSRQSLREGLEFSEAFVPYHLGKMPRSLAFLRQIRRDA
ncbi:DNA repair protein RecO [Desulfococcaceae bacterium HSG8]|nr:DNA repair protein RecO [Desulfococcaceae bacterium HSG8]